MFGGKHSEQALKNKELEKIIIEKDKVIFNMETEMSDVLQQIRQINESNECGDPSVKKRKISELCTDTIYKLLVKKNELSTSDQTENR